MDEARPDLDVLVRHGAFVRAVARAALRGDDEFEDVAQDAWLAALEQKATPVRSPRGWLSAVTRRQAALRLRRRGRERRRIEEHARRRLGMRAERSTGELAEQVETGRMLAGAVLRLPEAYREPILLRYYEELPPREIASRLGLPVETVRTRVKRGLARLRADLDEAHGGASDGWQGALLPLALSSRPEAGLGHALVLGGGVIVKKALGIGVAVLLLLVGVLAIRGMFRGSEEEPASERAAQVAHAPDADMPEADVVLRGAERSGGDGEDGGVPLAPRPTTDVLYRGRVLDLRRRPVSDVDVSLRAEGEVLATTRTDPQGRYHLGASILHTHASASVWPGETLRSRPLVVYAESDDGRAGSLVLSVVLDDAATVDWELAPLFLRPSHALTLEVRAGTEPLPDALVRVGAVTKPREGRWRWLDRVRTDADGRVVLEGLPAGTVGVLVRAEGWGLGLASTAVPRPDDAPLRVEMASGTAVDVRVRERGTDTAIAGAHVALHLVFPERERGPLIRTWCVLQGPEDEILPTDAEGRTRVPRPSEGAKAWVTASASEPRPRRRGGARLEVLPETTRVDLELEPHAEIVWPVADWAGEAPAEGTEVPVTNGPRIVYEWLVPAGGWIRDGRLVVPGVVPLETPASLELRVTLGDGRWAVAVVPKTKGEGDAIVFTVGRSLRVRVRDHEGGPVPWATVSLARLRMGAQWPLPDHWGSERVDEDGTHVFTGLPEGRYRVRVYGTSQSLRNVEQELDVGGGDATLDIRLPAPKRLRVTVLVDGKPGLPTEYTLHVSDLSLRERSVTEDPVSGELVVDLYAEIDLDGAPVRLVAPGFGAARQEATWVTDADEARVTLSLQSKTMLALHVRPPADGHCEIQLQRFAPEYGRFYGSGRPVKPDPERPTELSFGPLGEGRYRVVDLLTQLASDAVELVPGRGGALTLDLSRAGTVRGRVVVPQGMDHADVGIVVEGLIPADRPPGVQLVGPATMERAPAGAKRVEPDGRFAIRVPGDREVRIRAWHALLASAGEVEITTPRDDVVLRLARGPEAVCRVSGETTARQLALATRRVLLLPTAGSDHAVFEAHPVVTGDEVRFGGFRPGTWTVWIDAGRFRPVVLSDVTLGPGETRLEDVALETGSSVHVDVLPRTGEQPPPLRLRAEHMGEPSYIRAAIVMPGKEPVLSGLGPGRFRFMVRSMGRGADGARILLEEEIEVDGDASVQRTLDLR